MNLQVQEVSPSPDLVWHQWSTGASTEEEVQNHNAEGEEACH